MNDVAVLLPIRLETLFETDPRTRVTTMLLRVVPDEASIRRDDPVPTPSEVALLTAMWETTYAELGPELQDELPHVWIGAGFGRPAWELLCAQVSPARAAWLAARHPPTVVNGSITVEAPDAAPHTPPPNRVGGFPAEIEIWCSFNDADPVQLTVTTIDPEALVFDVIGGRREPDGGVTEQADRWWGSWEQACAVGLGLEIPLPDGLGPTDITVLYAVGLGEESPEEHFRAKIDAGDLAVLPLGSPTNAVDGAQAAALGHSVEEWRDVIWRRLWQEQNGQVDHPELSAALGGAWAALPAIPRPPEREPLDRMLVRTLWPALYGHLLRDVWGFGDAADRLGVWAADNLAPEGPLPPLRIGTQAYGLLPTSAMRSWRASAAEGDAAACGDQIVAPLLTLRARAADAARGSGTTVGADTARLLELLGRDGVSSGYAYRLFLADELWAGIYGMTTGVARQDFLDQVQQLFAPAVDLLGTQPARSHLTVGGAEPLAIPLVTPTTWPPFFWTTDEDGRPVAAMSTEAGLARLLETLRSNFGFGMAAREWGEVLPDSLLVRLTLLAGLLSAAAVVRADSGDPTPLLEPIISDTVVPTVLLDLAPHYGGPGPSSNPAREVRENHENGLERLFKTLDGATAGSGVPAQVERALRATVDSTWRVDPWLVGVAAQRLRHLGEQPDTRFRLGVYGWVDGPIHGEPGPTDGGLLHAPSHAQALTAVVLRDRFVSLRSGEREPWSMQLESARIRPAEELAEEVRAGAHLYEALGRQVERIVGGRDEVAALRAEFRLHPGRDAAGRACHGLDALDALLAPDPPLALLDDQRMQLELLRDALDGYGDLLVTEAVHQVVTGRADLAGAAMDAAAGLAAPPTLAFTETPLRGDGVTTTVIGVVPHRAAAAGTDSPAVLADPSVAAAIVARIGGAAVWDWTGPAGTVTLQQLGLEPVETLALSPDLLEALARHRLGLEPAAELRGTGARRHRQARQLVAVLGTQPAFGHDVAPPELSPDDAPDVADRVVALDAQIMADLGARYRALRTAAQRLIEELSAAAVAADPGRLGRALWRALRWGVTPVIAPAQQRAVFAAMLDGVAPGDPAILVEPAGRARDALQARLDAAQVPGAKVPLGRSIAELAAPEGRLAVLAPMRATTLAGLARLVTAPDPALDTAWLPVVAAVRPALARLEAFQLHAELTTDSAAGATGYSSDPDDHWQTAALARLQDRRAEPTGDLHARLPRFVAAYGLGAAWAAGGTVAVGLIDSWSEAIPRSRQTTTAAFGFNAPAARAPQAILLAVPPDPDATEGSPMQAADLVGTLVETRELAHARAARAEDLGDLATALPTAMLPGTGRSGIRLDAGTRF